MPVAVVLTGSSYDEGTEITPRRGRRRRCGDKAVVSTSRPAPARFAEAYAGAGGRAGVDDDRQRPPVRRLSGTYDSAASPPGSAAVPVHVVDSRTVGTALGFAVRSACEAAAGGPAARRSRRQRARRGRRARDLDRGGQPRRSCARWPDRHGAGARRQRADGQADPGASTTAWSHRWRSSARWVGRSRGWPRSAPKYRRFDPGGRDRPALRRAAAGRGSGADRCARRCPTQRSTSPRSGP